MKYLNHLKYIVFLIVKEVKTHVVQVSMLFRHGARSWIRTYPNESVPNSHWDSDGGLSQLTSIGRTQIMEFAEYFKSYYGDDILFNSELVSARASKSNRTIHSTEVFLDSMFGSNNISIIARQQCDVGIFSFIVS